MEATNASSGSTLAAFDHGAGTLVGAGEAGTVCPPSNVHVCSREYLPFTKSGPVRFQEIVAMCSLIRPLPHYRIPQQKGSFSSSSKVTSLFTNAVPVIVGIT